MTFNLLIYFFGSKRLLGHAETKQRAKLLVLAYKEKIGGHGAQAPPRPWPLPQIATHADL